MLALVAQSATCLTADSDLSDCRSRGREFDPGPVSSFRGDDHEIISTAIFLPSTDSRRVVFFILGNSGSLTFRALS